MKKFSGFPARMEFTPIPNIFFSTLLPQITDLAELKATLQVLAALYRKRGYPRFVTYQELAESPALMGSLKESGKSAEVVLQEALKAVAERGILLRLELERDGAAEEVYFLNTESNRQLIVKIQSGELKLSGLKPGGQPYVATEEPPDIFALYEQNIGMLTPLIADELRDAEKRYPEGWIRDAIKEAVNQGKRRWNYIATILERWSTEGRKDGTYPRGSYEERMAKYAKERYGHIVQH